MQPSPRRSGGWWRRWLKPSRQRIAGLLRNAPEGQSSLWDLILMPPEFSSPNMGAKRFAEMKEALRLHAAGVNAHAAARKAGVLPSSFYRLLAERRLRAAGVHARSPKP